MSRSEYNDYCDGWDLIRWRGAVASAIRGKRGQAFLREMREALDALPKHRLTNGGLIRGGDVCALGAVGSARGLDLVALGEGLDRGDMAIIFGIPEALAAEIMYENDEAVPWPQSPQKRWEWMRAWVEWQIRGVGDA